MVSNMRSGKSSVRLRALLSLLPDGNEVSENARNRIAAYGTALRTASVRYGAAAEMSSPLPSSDRCLLVVKALEVRSAREVLVVRVCRCYYCGTAAAAPLPLPVSFSVFRVWRTRARRGGRFVGAG
jgi:hypothetical protein